MKSALFIDFDNVYSALRRLDQTTSPPRRHQPDPRDLRRRAEALGRAPAQQAMRIVQLLRCNALRLLHPTKFAAAVGRNKRSAVSTSTDENYPIASTPAQVT